jgi:hypothetical protein
MQDDDTYDDVPDPTELGLPGDNSSASESSSKPSTAKEPTIEELQSDLDSLRQHEMQSDTSSIKIKNAKRAIKDQIQELR